MPDPKEFDEKFLDERTGETVLRIKVPEKYIADVENPVAENAAQANNFLSVCRQIEQLTRIKATAFDKATAAEGDIAKIVIRTRESMGLDSSWVYNIPLKSMEKREPPPDSATIGQGIPGPEAVIPGPEALR